MRMRISGINAVLGSKYFNIVLLAAYLVLWALLLPYYRFRLYADTCSYLDLARHYLEGNLPQAINGYWAPLISWLLVPFLRAGLDPLLSFKVLTMLSGVLAFFGAGRLLRFCRVMPLVRVFTLAALVPLLAWFALQVNTPDLLSAALLLFYLAEVQRLFDPGLADSPELPFANRKSLRQSLLVGALAGGAYLAKNYNFFFVLVHLAGLLFFHLKNKALAESPRTLLPRVSLAVLVFLLIAGCWMLPISQKYGRFTPGTAGRFNVNLVGPASPGFPYLYQGLLPPPHARASHSWEDPGLYHQPCWQPWASGADLAFELSLLTRNAAKYLSWVWHYHPLVLIIVPLALWFFGQPGKDEKRALGASLWAFFLYPLGYWLVYLEERHIWISILLAFILTAQVLSLLLRQARPWRQWLLLSVVAFALVNQPVRDLYDHRFVNQRQFHTQAQALQARLPLAGKNLATQDGNWHEGLFLSFFTRSRFYGQLPAATSDSTLYQNLKKHRIDYYLVWGEPQNNLDRLKKAVSLPQFHLTVYRVRYQNR
jgi:hypothetical protein